MATKKTFYLVTRDKEVEFHELPQGAKLPKGAKKVPRLPKPGEHWDGKKFVLNEEVEARFHQSEAEVAENHVLKRIEATLIQSGYELKVGLLSAEAEATGVDISVLADKVMEKAQDQMARETTRRKKIHAARQSRSRI